jgi:fructoselysine-6-P-deglycase FrlB-like protein
MVTLPGADQAVIDRAKVVDYLLSESHPVGRFKSVFFTALGYSEAAWEVLAADLQRHATDNEAVATEATQYGQKYEVRGSLKAPTGRTVVVITVWIILHGEHSPRFVTAFPGRRT